MWGKATAIMGWEPRVENFRMQLKSIENILEKKSIRVVACIIEAQGRFLITQRKQQSHLGHLWEFPGGKIEPGESLEACAIRECEEELGIQVKPVRLLEELEHDYPEVHVHLYFMLCESISGEPQALDCADFTWATPAQFKNYQFPAADEKVIENYIYSFKSNKKGGES